MIETKIVCGSLELRRIIWSLPRAWLSSEYCFKNRRNKKRTHSSWFLILIVHWCKIYNLQVYNTTPRYWFRSKDLKWYYLWQDLRFPNFLHTTCPVFSHSSEMQLQSTCTKWRNSPDKVQCGARVYRTGCVIKPVELSRFVDWGLSIGGPPVVVPLFFIFWSSEKESLFMNETAVTWKPCWLLCYFEKDN